MRISKRDMLLISNNKGIKYLSDTNPSFPFDVRGPYDAILANRWNIILLSDGVVEHMRKVRGQEAVEEFYGIVQTWVRPGGVVYIV